MRRGKLKEKDGAAAGDIKERVRKEAVKEGNKGTSRRQSREERGGDKGEK